MNVPFTDELPLAELAENPERVLGKAAMNATLHFCSPAHGGWGVIRVACLLPETHLLFVCPEACGRHGAIAAFEQGYRRRITYLCIDEREIILGGYGAEIGRALDDVMLRVQPRPKALLLFLPCIDDLLASDHSALIRDMEQKHGIPIRLTRMNPIMQDGKMPPMFRVQRVLYEFLPETPPPQKDRGIIILGAFRPPANDSELAALIRRLGFGPFRHPDFCSSFEEFTALSRSAAALVLRPEGNAAGDFLSTERNIPVLNVPVAFDEPSITARYQTIIDFLSTGVPLSAKDFFVEAREAVSAKLEKIVILLNGAQVALDSTVTASPFSLALALVQGGINVNRIYANYLPAHEITAFRRLAELRGSIIVANPNHAKKHGPRPARPLADIALGFEAGYATASPVTVPLAFDERRYGFEGLQAVLDAVINEVSVERDTSHRQNLREQIRSYGLVV